MRYDSHEISDDLVRRSAVMQKNAPDNKMAARGMPFPFPPGGFEDGLDLPSIAHLWLIVSARRRRLSPIPGGRRGKVGENKLSHRGF